MSATDPRLVAFFLCAGYGSRLHPLTHRIPKPLIPFQGKSAFRLNAEKVRELRPVLALCNSHYLPDLVEAEAEALGIRALREDTILGTGGCLGNAAPWLEGADLVLVHNGDILHNIDLAALLASHLRSGAAATLAGVHDPKADTLLCGPDGCLLGFTNFGAPIAEEAKRLTFSGVAVYGHDFLRHCRKEVSDIKPFWIEAMRDGHAIRVEDCSAQSWFDFGNPQGLWQAARWYMDQTGEHSYQYTSRNPQPHVANEAGVKGLPEGLQNILLLEDDTDPIVFSNSIFGRDFDWSIQP